MSTTSTVILHFQDRPGQQLSHHHSHHHHHPRSRIGSSRSASIIRQSCLFQLSLLTFFHLLTWSSCSPLHIAPLIATNLNSTSFSSTPLAVVQVPLKEDGGSFSSTFSSTAADSRSSSQSASVPASVISHGNNSVNKSSQPTSSASFSWTSSEISGNLSPLKSSSLTTNWPVIAQRQQVNEAVENQERTGQAPSTEHSTFLLFCSANSIRYWSASCPVHASASLLIKDRSSSIPHGISSLALWRPSSSHSKATNSNFSSTTPPVQLIWYDAEEGAFHRAAIHRKRSSTTNPGCDNLLGVAYNETLRFGDSGKNDDFGSEETSEARVKLSVDSRRHFLFASRFQNSRLDVFQLDIENSTAELGLLATISTTHPYEIALDEREQVLFWVEDKARICRLEYSILTASAAEASNSTQNLTALKHCTDDFAAGPQALTLDIARRKILWGDRNGLVYALDEYYFASGSTAMGRIISQPGDPHSVSNLAMSPSSTDALYLSDDQDLYRLNLTTGHAEVVSIESNIQFGLLVVEDLPEEEEGEDGDIGTTTLVPMPTSTANDNDHSVTESSSTSNPFDPSTQTSTLSPPLPSTTASPNTSFPSTSVPFLVFTLVPSLVVLLFILLTLILCCCSHHHPVLAEAQQRLHLNPASFKARTSAILGRRFTRYAQLRKKRANSTGRDQLIDGADHQTAGSAGDDLEAAVDGTGVTSCSPTLPQSGCCQQSTGDCCGGGGISNNSFYRSNIMRQHPSSAVNPSTTTTIEDIEDMFGSGQAQTAGNVRQASSRSTSNVHRPCMACRDLDMCAEKGFCMATYRVY